MTLNVMRSFQVYVMTCEDMLCVTMLQCYIPGTQHLHSVDIHTADGRGWPDGGHQRPAVHSGVPQVHHQVVVPGLTQGNRSTPTMERMRIFIISYVLPGERREVLPRHPDIPGLPSLQLGHQQSI